MKHHQCQGSTVVTPISFVPGAAVWGKCPASGGGDASAVPACGNSAVIHAEETTGEDAVESLCIDAMQYGDAVNVVGKWLLREHRVTMVTRP